MVLHDEFGRFQGDPGNLSGATSVRGPSVRRERSMKFREFGLYASRVQQPPTASTSHPALPIPSSSIEPLPSLEADDVYRPDSGHHATEPTPTNNTSTPLSSPARNFSRPGSSTTIDEVAGAANQYDFAPQTPRTPLPVLSPRWDSLANSTTIVYSQSAISLAQPLTVTAASSPGPPTPNEDLPDEIDSLVSETRDEFDGTFPLGSLSKMNSIDSRHAPYGEPAVVDNFSRPRKSASIRQASLPRAPNTFSSHSEPPSQLDMTGHQHLLWPRERGQSISSNKSTATFNSLPVRPSPSSDSHMRDSIRGRSRQPNSPASRIPTINNGSETNGSSFARDPYTRMASIPDELRSSFRSQLSASTAPGTSQTERSSVMTKTSSVTSISQFGTVDDTLSVDDVMGMYEQGFRDDSPAPVRSEYEDDDSRPPTPRSEISRRKSAMLEAMSDPLPIPNADSGVSLSVPKFGPEIRDSHAIFRVNDSPALPPKDVDSSLDFGAKHDSGKLLDDDEDDDFVMRSPKRQQANMTFEEAEASDDTRDIYGFRKENQYVTRQQYDEWNVGYRDYMSRRKKKWTGFLKESGLMTEDPNRFPQRSAKTKRFVRKGIPPEWRGSAWFYYAGGPAIVAKHAGVYDDLLTKTAKDVDNEAIERDLHRTFPDNVKFRSGRSNPSEPSADANEARNSQQTVKEPTGNAARPDESAMISSLRRVLHAFSIYNPRIGYCQSLNFLAGLLLLFVETEEYAFWLLNIITRVYLPGTHELSLEGANVDLGVLMSALRDAMPAVWGKIGGELDGSDAPKKPKRTKKGLDHGTRLPPITLCMTAWFMSCFIGTLPIETTLRVWDVFFYEGSKTLFRIALAVFKIGESEIRGVGDPMEIFQVVQTIPRRLIDANSLMEACFKRRNGFGHLSQETIEERRQERRDANKIERAEQARLASGLGDEVVDVKRKGTLFGRREKKRPAEVM